MKIKVKYRIICSGGYIAQINYGFLGFKYALGDGDTKEEALEDAMKELKEKLKPEETKEININNKN